ncbi:MAG TPA: biotin/lipoyl-containing protein [Thermoanaerobaculia bacterium]|nr:biotin/lipoyl-containing protein [Thermoanaerobaculia bacterium]
MKFIARRDGADIPVEVERLGSGYRVKLGEKTIVVDVVETGRFIHSLRLEDGTQFAFAHHREGTMHHVSLGGANVAVEIVDPLALRRKGGDDQSGAGGVLKAPMPGRIVRLLVNKNDSVQRGQSLLILEAMKMENDIQSPVDGVVDEIFVSSGDTVEAGGQLLHVREE